MNEWNPIYNRVGVGNEYSQTGAMIEMQADHTASTKEEWSVLVRRREAWGETSSEPKKMFIKW